MLKNSLSLFLWLIFSVWLSGPNSLALNAIIRPASIDAHVHLNFESLGEQLEKIKTSGILDRVDHLLLISPSYLVTSGYSPSGNWMRDRELGDQLTSQLVTALDGRATGICGAHLLWEDLEARLKDCLSLPGMKGIKIRNESNPFESFNWDQISFTNKVNTERFIRAVERAGSKAKFALMHLHMPFFQYRDELLESFLELGELLDSDAADESQASQQQAMREKMLKEPGFLREVQENNLTEMQNGAEVRAVLEIVKRFPAVQFILAHGANDWRNLKVINAIESSGRIQNLWIESSTVFRTVSIFASSLVPATDLVISMRGPTLEQWRRFGMERILFGSDYSVDKFSAGKRISMFEDMLLHLAPCSCEGDLSNCGCASPNEARALRQTSGQKFLQLISR